MSYMSLKIVQLRFFFFMLRMIEKRKKMVVQLALVLMLLYHNSRKVHVPSEEVKVKGKTGSFFRAILHHFYVDFQAPAVVPMIKLLLCCDEMVKPVKVNLFNKVNSGIVYAHTAFTEK